MILRDNKLTDEMIKSQLTDLITAGFRMADAMTLEDKT